jgi:hypothetical protein
MKAVNPLLPRDPLVLNNKMLHPTAKVLTKGPTTRRKAKQKWRHVYISIIVMTSTRVPTLILHFPEPLIQPERTSWWPFERHCEEDDGPLTKLEVGIVW